MVDRKWARKGFIQSEGFRKIAKAVYETLSDYDYALIGGLAVSCYANPPVTVDADFLVNAETASLRDSLVGFEAMGWKVGLLRFTHRRRGFPEHGFQLKKGKLVLDLIATGEDEYLRSVVQNGKLRYMGGEQIKVVSANDLVVIKSLVGRDKDIDDVAELSRSLGDKLDWDYINEKIGELE